MIPLLVLIPAGLSAIVGVGASIDGVSRINAAKKRLLRRHRRLQRFYRDKVVPVAWKAKFRVEALQKERLASLCVLRDAATILGKLRQEPGGTNILNAESVGSRCLRTWDALGVDAGEVLANIGTGVAVGAAISGGAFAATASLGIASTGTTIASLTGVAASNATMAALGGGTLAAGGAGMAGGAMVLGGLAAAPVLIVAGIGLQFKAVDSEKEASLACAKLDRKEGQLRRDRETARAIGMRAKELRGPIKTLREDVEGLIQKSGKQPDFRRLAAAATALSQCLAIAQTPNH